MTGSVGQDSEAAAVRSTHRQAGSCWLLQASNFWTRAAAVSRYRTKAHAPIGGRKLRKTCLLLATAPKKRNGGFIRQTGNNERLVQSSFRYWLFLYRNHAVREENGCPGDREAEGLSGSSTNVLSPSEELLRRNPLHEANLLKLLDGFQRSQERVRLGTAWLYWRGIYNTVIMVKGMGQTCLMERSWNIWRRRFLQSVTAQTFLLAEKKFLCQQVFTKWKNQTRQRRAWNEPEGSSGILGKLCTIIQCKQP
ncbi:uncharacterized protein LOC134577043 [Pelobates fuscus]|uniref:uncharacterized protein LOC134577043 n=1 Tax=Pelobates fuscus TaxID=191477 RepID=UPI002FE4A43B